jgi:hypothetical protein
MLQIYHLILVTRIDKYEYLAATSYLSQHCTQHPIPSARYGKEMNSSPRVKFKSILSYHPFQRSLLQISAESK